VYRRHHSTETALLRVLSEIYSAADRKDITLLGLLDLSAAFDCVDHDILARRLQQSFGSVERRYRGFSRSSTVALSRSAIMDSYRPSSSCYSACHRAVLGPLLFLLYTVELFEIIASAGLVGHSYTPTTRSAPAASASVSTQRFICCVERIDAMNADKTQLVWLGSRNSTAACQADHYRAPTAFCLVKPSSTVIDLGVNIDGQLTMAYHVAALRRSCLFE